MSSKKNSSRRSVLISASFLLFSLLLWLNSSFTSKTIQSLRVANLSAKVSSLSNFTNEARDVFVSSTEQDYIAPPSSLTEDESGLIAPLTSSCDIFDGSWVYDEFDPIYAPGSCPYIDNSFNCYKSGRPDLGYLKYRWQPYGCNIMRFDGKKMLEILRGKTMVFVGDSLNRNMWESLICSLSRFANISRSEVMKNGLLSHSFKDYDCSVIFITAPFLVQSWDDPKNIETPIAKLRLDKIKDIVSQYHDADFLIFNTGHWWNQDKCKHGENFFQEGDVLHAKMEVEEAYIKAINTWAKWVDETVNPNKTKVFWMGVSAIHFSGGAWNYNGRCDGETEPTTDEKLLKSAYPWIMQTLESVISEMKTPVNFMNITKLTDYRKDGHPSKYRRPGFKWRPGRPQDCSHWCLPGVPDSWNQILYSLLVSSDGSGAAN